MSLASKTPKALAETRGIIYIDESDNSPVLTSLEAAKIELKRKARRSWWRQIWLVAIIRWIRAGSATSNEVIARTYDQEYGNKTAQYGYASAMLSRVGFETVTGLAPSDMSAMRIIDIGAGSNEFLRFCKGELGIPSSQLSGSDISLASKRIIESDGFTAYQGRLENLDLPKEGFDLAYLSYFIDYDTDQEATFDAVIDVIKPGGRIVLEGQFPVRPFALLKKDSSSFAFITKGESVEGDILLLQEAFARLGQAKGKTVRLERIMNIHRYVQSHYGFNRLPSLFLTFVVE